VRVLTVCAEQDRHFERPCRIILFSREQQEFLVVEGFVMVGLGSSLVGQSESRHDMSRIYTPTRILKEDGLRWSRDESSFNGVLHF
jgi:hypothetical protein